MTGSGHIGFSPEDGGLNNCQYYFSQNPILIVKAPILCDTPLSCRAFRFDDARIERHIRGEHGRTRTKARTKKSGSPCPASFIIYL